MSNLDMAEIEKKHGLLRRLTRPRFVIKVAAPLLVVGGIFAVFTSGEEATFTGATVPVKRGPLKITVVEGGSVAALESQEVKSEVEGQTKILYIIEEGYTVTKEDVQNKKLLVELDSKDLRERQISQELEYQNSLAAFTESKEEYQIQVNQNRSDVNAAELAEKFALMDFEKYMGEQAAADVLKQVTLEEDFDVPLPTSDLDQLNETGDGTVKPEEQKETPAKDEKKEEKKKEEPAAAAEKPEDAPEPVEPPQSKPSVNIDFAKYTDIEVLGDGDAGQRLRKLEDDYVLAKKELGLSETLFEGTQRLADKEFVTKNELDNERLKVERNQIQLKSAETSRELFIKYEFPKMAEKALSDYMEAHQRLIRSKKLATSKLAQSEAKLKSSEARYTLQARKRVEFQEQIAKCKIYAERPGLVVYGEGEEWRDEDRIEEGATVRHRQRIITIPDMSQMAVEVKIHESAIQSVQKAQKAKIRVDAYPDEELTGEVVKLAVLPDSQNRWMNPDVKVFETKVSVEGMHPWLKPEMSAQVEILVKELPDVLYVPIQAVVPGSNGQRLVYVSHLGGPEARAVETGESNEQFIEIKNGLKEGEDVLLRAPTSPEEKSGEENGAGDKGENKDRGQKNKAADEKPKDTEKKAEKAPAQDK
jgi:hypothetical protein